MSTPIIPQTPFPAATGTKEGRLTRSLRGGHYWTRKPPLRGSLLRANLHPNDPQNFVWLNLLSLAHLFTGAPDKALAAAIKGRKVRPVWRPIYETLTSCYVALDQHREARDCRAEMAQWKKPSGDALAPLRGRNPAWA